MNDLIAYPAEHEQWLLRLAVASGIGFIIGLEREFAKQREQAGGEGGYFAGLRTYTLFGVLGYVSALCAEAWGVWFLGVALAGFIALVVASYVFTSRLGDVGLTSEVTAVLTFLLGALAFHGALLVAVVTGVLVLVLLRFKLALHDFVMTMTEREVVAIVQFVVISALVLPFLPDEGYGPGGVWNPKEIWTMVILVSGISLAGYLLTKVLGGRKGMVLSGVLGGLVSSTAVALGHARRSHAAKGAVPYLALGIVVASSIMFPRMLLEVAVLNGALAERMWLPLMVAAASGVGMALLLVRGTRGAEPPETELSNPLNFGMAVRFALIYAGVRWLMAFATEHYGALGGYVAAVLSGATDVDAVTLGTARAAGPEAGTQAVVIILLAALSNTAVKCIIALVVGSSALRKQVLPGFLAMFAVIAAAIAWHARG